MIDHSAMQSTLHLVEITILSLAAASDLRTQPMTPSRIRVLAYFMGSTLGCGAASNFLNSGIETSSPCSTHTAPLLPWRSQ